jgi:hypothetical protein
MSVTEWPYVWTATRSWRLGGEKNGMPTPSVSNGPVGHVSEETGPRRRVLWLSTAAFTLLFNVWLMLGVLAIPIRQSLGLTDAHSNG